MQQAPEAMTLKVIAHIHTAFPTKFGIPRQSGLVEELRGEIIFTPEYRTPDALRGLEDFSHIWLVWQHPCGRVCHPLPLPTEPSGAFQRKAGGH